MYIKVHVYPGMRREKVTQLPDHTYEFVLREPAAGNAANRRARELLAELRNVPLSSVRLVNGHRSQSKLFDILEA